MTKKFCKLHKACDRLLLAALASFGIGTAWILIEALQYMPFSTLPKALALFGAVASGLAFLIDHIATSIERR